MSVAKFWLFAISCQLLIIVWSIGSFYHDWPKIPIPSKAWMADGIPFAILGMLVVLAVVMTLGGKKKKKA